MSSPALSLSLAAASGALFGSKLSPEQAFTKQHAPRGACLRAAHTSAELPREGPKADAVLLSRRDAVLLASAAAISSSPLAGPALAIGAPKGYSAKEDPQDRYRFFYPFGWQEVVVKGQDVVFKDVIEPLESVAVNVIKTEKSNIREVGPVESVAQALVDKVLTGPTQKSQLIKAEEKEADGKVYYTFEFVADAPSYKRHALGVVTVANGKFYTLTTGSKERRWPAMEEKLRAVVNSFQAI